MANTRLIPFNGDDPAYIRFLERRVFELEKSMACLSDSRMNTDFSSKGRTFSRTETSPNIIPSNRPLATKRTRGPPRRQEYSGQMNVEIDGLKVIEFCPNDTHSRPRKRVSREGPKLRWQSDMDKFISLIQPLSEWTDHHPSIRDRSIPGFVQGRAFSHDIPEDQSSASSPQKYILSNLARFCDFAVGTNQSGAFYRQVRCFRELILFSLSNVVLKMGFDKGDVYQIIRKFSGSKANDKHLKKLLAGAMWANHAISALSKTRWGSKAWEIFFAAGQSVPSYARYAENSESRNYFLQAMEEKSTGCTGEERLSQTSPLIIPLIIGKIVGGTVSIQQLCEYLGYDSKPTESLDSLDTSQESSHVQSSIQPQSDVPKCRIADQQSQQLHSTPLDLDRHNVLNWERDLLVLDWDHDVDLTLYDLQDQDFPVST